MKIPTLAVAAATAITAAAAQPHGHQHKHKHMHPHPHLVKKQAATVTDWAPAATAFVFELEGQEIPEEQACWGLENHSLSVEYGGAVPTICSAPSSSSPSSSSSSSSSPTTTSSWSASSAAEFFQQSSSGASSWTSSATPAASSTSSSQGLGADFPTGQVPCSQFPSDYGAVYIDYLDLGGWIGVQTPGSVVDGLLDDISTAVSGGSCTEGGYCSYACPPGWQKTQWPSAQGATGQSVGGLQCTGGMLQLTNPSLSSSLCMQGVGGVSAQNNAGSVVSICRTDYPGTESETVPTVVEAGETQPLTVPDADNYYVWEGKSTSAQYYLNPPGYDASQACQWGSPGEPLGNYAPINFGVGAKDGTTWISIMANTPTTTAQYPGTVEIQGDISGSCSYSNGQFYSNGSPNSAGCTVSVNAGGSAVYVIS